MNFTVSKSALKSPHPTLRATFSRKREKEVGAGTFCPSPDTDEACLICEYMLTNKGKPVLVTGEGGPKGRMRETFVHAG
jgi:hypothetical protein